MGVGAVSMDNLRPDEETGDVAAGVRRGWIGVRKVVHAVVTLTAASDGAGADDIDADVSDSSRAG